MNIPDYRRELKENIMNDRLVILRLNAHYSQEEVAYQLHMDAKAYGKYERGETLPSIDTVVLLADIYGVSTDYILTGKETSVSQRLSSILEKYDADTQTHILDMLESMLAMINTNTLIKR